MAQNLEKSILATLVYFDVFDYPLTLVEIQRLMLRLRENNDSVEYTLTEIQKVLDESILLEKAIRFKNGFFYLRGRENVLAERHNRYIFAKRKYDKAMEVVNVLSRIPFVRAIFVCNSLAIQNTTEKSDIDLVIITKRGGVWWARLLSLLYLSLNKLRPGQESTSDKICLSIFLDEDHLNLAELKMGKNDFDFSYWAANFYPIYDAGEYYSQFWQANKNWLKENLPQSQSTIPHSSLTERHKPTVRVVLEIVLLPFSKIVENFQKAKFPNAIKELVNTDTRVVVSDGILKFHVNDRRIEHLEEFIKKYESALSHSR
jgi:hypothetical protein